MRAVILMVAAGVLSCFPRSAFAQKASINGYTNNDYTYYNNSDPVPIVSNQSTGTPYFDCYNFQDGDKYRISILRPGPVTLAQNVQQSMGSSVIGDDIEFTWHTGDKFHPSYYIAMGTGINQTEYIDFAISHKALFWFYQSTFRYTVNTTCTGSYTLFNDGYPLQGIDYEVSNNLTVTNIAYPNGGLTELDAGQSVTLLPGFATNLAGGGAVSVIIDGCGGAYRLAGPTEVPTNGAQVITNQANNGMKFFPNPVKNELSFELADAQPGQIIKVRVMDLNGKLLYDDTKIYGNVSPVNMAGFEPGLYFVSVTGDNINLMTRIIKE